jgi:hypothetical protein
MPLPAQSLSRTGRHHDSLFRRQLRPPVRGVMSRLLATRVAGCGATRPATAGSGGPVPREVATGRVPVCPQAPGELVPSALHTVERHANNQVGVGHGWLKARLRPMRGLKRHRSARIPAAGRAFVPEPAPRPLRHRHRDPEPPSALHRLRRTRIHHVNLRCAVMILNCRPASSAWPSSSVTATLRARGHLVRRVLALVAQDACGGRLAVFAVRCGLRTEADGCLIANCMTNCPCPGSGARQRPCLTRAAVSASLSRRMRLSTPNALEVPGSLLEAIQQRLARDDVDAILRGAGPLTNWDRRQLELARRSWQDSSRRPAA